LIDFQQDFLGDDARMPIARNQRDSVIAAANRAVAEAREHGDLIVAIGNEFPPYDWLMNLLRRNAARAGTTGARWDDRIDATGATYFPKMRGDAFTNPDLPRFLDEHGVEEVTMTGLMAKACVVATTRGAIARGLRVRLLEPAIADTSDREKANAIRRLGALPGVTVTS
jgi:nicotinamidase-related amidase